MRKNNILSINHWIRLFSNRLIQSIVFYVILAIFLVPHYQYLINPDGVSYISCKNFTRCLHF